MQPKIYGIGSKVNQFINTLVCNYMLKTGVTQPKIYRIYKKVNQFIYTLVCNYMPNIRMLAKAVLKIFCSQGCSYTKMLVSEKESKCNQKFTE